VDGLELDERQKRSGAGDRLGKEVIDDNQMQRVVHFVYVCS
jgi:hypothetical protein